MAQQNEPHQTLDPATAPVKRKRGRPRKEDAPAIESGGRTQRRRRNQQPDTGPGLVGQPVSGVLDGVFDAGFLLTVRVGDNGPLLKGMVFDSRLSVPVTAANDVAPHIKMSKRDEIPIPVPISAEPLQRRGPTVSSLVENKVVLNDDIQGSVLRSKGSGAVISGEQAALQEAVPETVQMPENRKQMLTGVLNLNSTSKASEVNETSGEPNLKLDSTSKISEGSETAAEPSLISCKEAAGEPKLETTNQTTPFNETQAQPKPSSTSQSTPVSETPSELKPDSTGQTTPVNETPSELKQGSMDQATPVKETVGGLKLDSSSQKSPEPLSDLGSEKAEAQNDSDQIKFSASAAAAAAAAAATEGYMSQDVETNPVGNEGSQMPFSGGV